MTIDFGILLGVCSLLFVVLAFVFGRLSDAKKQGANEERITQLEKRIDRFEQKQDVTLEKLDLLNIALQKLITEHEVRA